MCQKLCSSAIPSAIVNKEIFSFLNIVRKNTNVIVAEAKFWNPSELVNETVKSVVSGDLTYITRL
jgi:hypothetical protein